MKEETSYTRMLRLLKATGLYRLDGTTAVEIEMQLYAGFFDEAEKKLSTLLEDRFPETMTEAASQRWKRLYALPKLLLRKDARELIGLRERVTNRDFTKAGVLRCMASGGFTAALEEDVSGGRVTVTVTKDKGVFDAQEDKEAFLRECLPCHVTPEFVWEC